ncbi:hypothetical protein G5V58_04690 [Nocardioides anomalus]|uniref:J domain-containing protein n=1 Tax=Nocardioides anomalus TaxID=2712223 RepID=A0A6G6WAG8_9ACTN|nr:hypothetical protein [Nocardioides anomalus]QIG42157.1 hypothetical protein G5V58_04690 [Nocardioides anomalus]
MTTRTDAELRAARRAVARRLHPDLGGDAEEFARAMAALDRAERPGPAAVGPVAVRSRWTRARAAARGARGLRTRLPASWPGARRYGSL